MQYVWFNKATLMAVVTTSSKIDVDPHLIELHDL